MTQKNFNWLIDSKKARDYFLNTLKQGNTLAQELLRFIQFDSGNFFVLVSEEADTSRINEFNSGGILKQNQLEKITVLGNEYSARRASNSVRELASYLERQLNHSNQLTCMFEDVVISKTDPCLQKINASKAYYNDEVYYYINGSQYNLEKLEDLIKQSDNQWYYLNIITSEPICLRDNKLTLEQIQKITSNTFCIVLGAYDMEGYLVWKQKGSNSN